MQPVRLIPVTLEPVTLQNTYLQSEFTDYYAKLPLTLAADESAGLNTSANRTGDPYGANLQPNPDMSGTGGTTSGAGTVNGDVADDWNVEADGGTTTTAGKSANDYQKYYSSGGTSRIYTAGISIVTGDVFVAEIYASGVVSTPQWRVSQSNGTNFQVIQNLVNGYQREIFTSTATFTGANFVLATDGEGATIHWTRLRKLTGPSSCLLSEVDRTLRANGTELHTDANAASDPNGNEADAITGFTSIGLTGTGANVFESQGAVKSTGSYALHADANDTPTSNARFFKDLQTDFGLSNGDVVQISFNSRHDGTGGDWQIRLGEANSGTGINTLLTVLASTDTTFTPLVYQYTHSADTRYLVVRELSGTNDGGVYFDNFSAQEMQPTASMIERVDNAETFLIEQEPIVYGDTYELELVKDGSVATMFYNSLIVDAKQTIDSSLENNVIHSAYGATGESIVNLTFGALIVTGTLTSGIIYHVITTEVDNFGTGVVVGDYFNSAGTETCDANNTVKQVVGQ